LIIGLIDSALELLDLLHKRRDLGVVLEEVLDPPFERPFRVNSGRASFELVLGGLPVKAKGLGGFPRRCDVHLWFVGHLQRNPPLLQQS
jgi:hypothetical protein